MKLALTLAVALLVTALVPICLTSCSDDTSDSNNGGTDTGVGADTGESDVSGGGGLTEATAVVNAAGWGDNVTISVSGDSFSFNSDGLPDHGSLEAYAVFGGGSGTITVIETPQSFEIPLQPEEAASTTQTNQGPIGIAISGAVFFNPYEGDATTVALADNFETDGVPFIDSCNGHPLGSGASYHYHGVPYCITDVIDADGQHSTLLGYLLDGFPIYGPQGEGGTAPADLDACSSHVGPTPEFPNGIRHYHLTETAPYSIECYVGTAATNGPPGGR